MPEIGNLLVALQMETASFNKGIAEANAKLTGFGRQFAGVARTIDGQAKTITGSINGIAGSLRALAFGGAVAGIAGWVKSMADSGEAAENLAIALGLPIAELRRLEGVLIANGTTADEAARTLTKLAVALRDALAEPTGTAARAFKDLGISQQQLQANSNNLSGVIDLLANAFQKLPDGPQKTAAMAELLSGRWRTLIGLFKDGADGLAAQKKAFDDLNPGMAAFDEAAKAVDKSLDNLFATITATGRDAFAVFVDFIQEGINRLQTTVEELRKIIQFYNFFKNLMQGSDVATAVLPEVVVTAKPTSIPKTAGPKKGGGGAGKGEDALARAAERELERRQREAIEAAEEQSKISDELFRRREQALKHDLAMEKITKQESIAAERKLLDEKWAATQGFYKKKLEAAVADQDETRKLRAAEKLDEERYLTEREATFQESALETRNKFKEVFSDLGDSIKGSLGSAFDALIEGTFKLRDAIGNLLKSIGKKLADKAFDALFNAAGSALFGGSAGGGIFGSLFGGLAKAQNGAHWRVGGAGALDSQLVAFRASPGEMVDVTRQSDARRGGGTIRIDLNPSEGWVAGVADQRIVTRSGQIIEVAVRQSQRTVARNFGGMSAEAQARQL